jgi:hypothetical protein
VKQVLFFHELHQPRRWRSFNRSALFARFTLRPLTALAGLVVGNDTQLRPALLRLKERRLPLPRQILEAVRLEQPLLELSTLKALSSESGG